jgi:hypothetical protein
LILKGIAELAIVYQRGITELDACTYLVPSSLNWDRSLFGFRGNLLGNQWRRSLRNSWQN